ncbi:MAG: hypothetical protein HZA03_01740 [Nitrospinae bacterium]|nr:hypothetical protein [Nitrospinota bacterium]
MKMDAVIRNVKTLAAVAVLALVFTACSSGGGEEDKYQAAFTKINPEWKVYEVKKEGENTIIRVEAADVVPFAEAKKALDALQAADPKLQGYVEFYNKEVGIVLRKLEIMPAT